MASPTAQKLAQSFDDTSPTTAVKPCCQNVVGEWIENPDFFPTEVPKFEGLDGVDTSYVLDAIPRKLKLMGRFHIKGEIRGKLRCVCKDDGRVLSEQLYKVPFGTDVRAPVGSVDLLKKIAPPWISWLSTAWELAQALKKAYDIYSLNPALAKELLALGAKNFVPAVKKIYNSATEICKVKHKCAKAPEALVS